MDNTSDKEILMASTDWFSRVSTLYEPWGRATGAAREAVTDAARIATNSILPSQGSYYDADFSETRIQKSKAIFNSELKRRLNARDFELSERLFSYIRASGDLNSNEYWSIRALFIKQVASKFSDDQEGAVPDSVRNDLSQVAPISDVLQIEESVWDRQISRRFGDLPSALKDFADANFLPRCFFSRVAFSLIPYAPVTPVIESFSDWTTDCLMVKFGFYMSSEGLFKALNKEINRAQML